MLVISGPERTADVSASWILHHPAWIDVFAYTYACKRERLLYIEYFFLCWTSPHTSLGFLRLRQLVSHFRRLMTRPSTFRWDPSASDPNGLTWETNIAPLQLLSAAIYSKPYSFWDPPLNSYRDLGSPPPQYRTMSLSLNQLGTGANDSVELMDSEK